MQQARNLRSWPGRSSSELSITSLGTSQNSLAKPIGSVTLLGGGDVVFSQTANASQITYPSGTSLQTAAGFKIGPPTIVK